MISVPAHTTKARGDPFQDQRLHCDHYRDLSQYQDPAKCLGDHSEVCLEYHLSLYHP